MAIIKTGKIEIAGATGEHIYASSAAAGFAICKSPGKLKILLDEIKPGKNVFYISDGDWSMHDLVMELVKKYQPAELFITSYAIREYPIRQLILAMSRKEITAVNMILDYRANIRTPAEFKMAELNFKIFLVSLHAKVTVIKSAAGSVVITGSANWTKNPKIESGVVSMDDGLADFYIDNIKKIMAGAKIFE